MNLNHDITSIESALFLALKSTLPNTNVFASRRSSTSNSDLVVVGRCVTEVVDKNAFGQTICRVEVYVKEKGGLKDAARMTDIKKKIMAALPFKTQSYTFTYMSNIPIGFDQNTRYDLEVVNLTVIIN